MVKRPLFIFVIFLVIAAGVGSGIWYWRTKTNGPLISPVEPEVNTLMVEGLLTWDDPAGFIFQYPKGLKIDQHDEDQENYAHVELTDNIHSGRVIVWAKDTTAADVTAWLRTEKSFADAAAIDTTLGNQPAKKILVSGKEKKIVVGAVYDELLFTVEAQPEGTDYWSVVQQTIVDSFKFKPLPQENGGTSAGADSTGTDEFVDEEEVIE